MKPTTMPATMPRTAGSCAARRDQACGDEEARAVGGRAQEEPYLRRAQAPRQGSDSAQGRLSAQAAWSVNFPTQSKA